MLLYDVFYSLSSDLQVVLLLGFIRLCLFVYLSVLFFCVGLVYGPCCLKQMNEWMNEWITV